MVHIRTQDQVAANLRLNANDGGFQNLHRLISKQFSNCFNSYAKAYNKVYKRNGSLFQQNMKAKKIDSDEYFTRLILYIHNNPVKHGFVDDPWDWPYSSIHQFVNKPSKSFELSDGCSKKLLEASKEKVINWFGNIDAFEQAHAGIREVRSVFD